MNACDAEKSRLDAWLWRTRFFKTRGEAARHVETRGVRVRRDGLALKTKKASFLVRPGDVLTFATRRASVVLRVDGLIERRVGANQARECFTVIETADA